MPSPKLLKLAEAAAVLGVTRGCIRKWLNAGLIVPYRVGPPRVDALNRNRSSLRLSEKQVNALIIPPAGTQN